MRRFFEAVERGRGPRLMADRVEHRFGHYGGRYVPETLMPALAELEQRVGEAREDPAFRAGSTISWPLRRAPDAALPRAAALGARRRARST